MSSPTMPPHATGSAHREVADFVAAVRAQLGDLQPDEVNELTGGLEADLVDALAESGGSPSQHYGDPVAYAAELRAAAGLPPRGAAIRERRGHPILHLDRMLFEAGRAQAAQWGRRLEVQPWWPEVRDFLVVLRPAWWVVRAWVVVSLVLVLFGIGSGVSPGFGGLVLILGAIVVSVQLGRNLTPRGSIGAERAGRLSVLWNVLAMLFILPVLFNLESYDDANYYESERVSSYDGLVNNGEAVQNIFPYDAQGNPLTGVQLYDQKGQPVEIGEGWRYVDTDEGMQHSLVPLTSNRSLPQWNAFPLQVHREDWAEVGMDEGVEQAPRPFPAVPPLLLPPTSTPDPTVTSGPDASATPVPSATADVTPKPKADPED